MNKTALNILIESFLNLCHFSWVNMFHLLGKYLEVELLNNKSKCMLNFLRNAKYFQMSSAFVIVSLLNFNHSHGCVIVTHCASIHISLITKNYEHFVIDLLTIFFSLQGVLVFSSCFK